LLLSLWWWINIIIKYQPVVDADVGHALIYYTIDGYRLARVYSILLGKYIYCLIATYVSCYWVVTEWNLLGCYLLVFGFSDCRYDGFKHFLLPYFPPLKDMFILELLFLLCFFFFDLFLVYCNFYFSDANLFISLGNLTDFFIAGLSLRYLPHFNIVPYNFVLYINGSSNFPTIYFSNI